MWGVARYAAIAPSCLPTTRMSSRLSDPREISHTPIATTTRTAGASARRSMSAVTQPFVDRAFRRQEVVAIDVAAEFRDDDVRVGIDERDGQRLRLPLFIVGTQAAPLGERRGGCRC